MLANRTKALAFVVCGVLVACGGAAETSSASASSTPSPGASTTTSSCSRTTYATPNPTAVAPLPPVASGLTVPSGFTITTIATISNARELSVAPNGDLFVGTSGQSVWVIPHADDAGVAGTPQIFATIPDAPLAGVLLVPSLCTIYIGSMHGVYAVAYQPGDLVARSTPQRIAAVRTASERVGHVTTSLTYSNGVLYASVGSSSNNTWPEIDATRATVQAMNPDGTAMHAAALQFRNAIALTTNPQTGTVWAGGAGQDSLPPGHPYEFLDGITTHTGTPNYGWPFCEENHVQYQTPPAGFTCTQEIAPAIVAPAYGTIIGATFYPTSGVGSNVFPTLFRGGLFFTLHGSWHKNPDGTFVTAPAVDFVPMSGDAPNLPPNWNDPTTQWSSFVTGFQLGDGVTRIGRPTGITIGPTGSLFFADDQTGNIYRVRP